MWLTDYAHGHEKDTSSRKFVVTLNMIDGASPEVRSCEIIGPGYRNRTSFGDTAQLNDVFSDAVAEGLKACLANISQPTEVIALPDFVIEAPGLTLAGAYLMAKDQTNGSLHIILRFRIFLGSINRILNRQVGFDDRLQDENSRLAALVFEDLAMPILNICESASTGLLLDGSRLSDFAEKLSARAHEITFQIELVKRFAAQPDDMAPHRADRLLEQNCA